MIEVEKKFQPTDEQLEKMLEGAEFFGEVILNDIYYDYLDYRLLKKSIRLRNRNGSFELKIGKGGGIAEEIEDEAEIAKYFGAEEIHDFLTENMVVIMEFSNKRKSYLKEGFSIVLDDMSFDYKMCEIELIVEVEEEVKQAEEKILNFAKKYGLEQKKNIGKRQEYLKRFKPEIYKEVFGDK